MKFRFSQRAWTHPGGKSCAVTRCPGACQCLGGKGWLGWAEELELVTRGQDAGCQETVAVLCSFPTWGPGVPPLLHV